MTIQELESVVASLSEVVNAKTKEEAVTRLIDLVVRIVTEEGGKDWLIVFMQRWAQKTGVKSPEQAIEQMGLLVADWRAKQKFGV